MNTKAVWETGMYVERKIAKKLITDDGSKGLESNFNLSSDLLMLGYRFSHYFKNQFLILTGQ